MSVTLVTPIESDWSAVVCHHGVSRSILAGPVSTFDFQGLAQNSQQIFGKSASASVGQELPRLRCRIIAERNLDAWLHERARTGRD